MVIEFYNSNFFFFIIKYFIFIDIFFIAIFCYKTNIIYLIRKRIHSIRPNGQLMYGLVEVHPPFFYLIIIFFVFYIFLFYIQNFYFKLDMTTVKLIFLPFFALATGGFWSFFNNSWGFFWVWDKIEMVLLSIFLSLVVIHHKNILLTNTNKLFLFFFFILNYIYLIRVGFYQSRHSFSISKNKSFKTSFLYFNYFLDNFSYLSNTFFFYYLKICNLNYNLIKKINSFLLIFFFFLFFLFFFSIILIDNAQKASIQYHFFFIANYILLYLFLSNKKFSILYKIQYNSLFYSFSFNKTSLLYYFKKIYLNTFGIYYFCRPINSYIDAHIFFSFDNLKYAYIKTLPDYVSYLSFEIFNNIYNNSNYKPTIKLKTLADNLVFYSFEPAHYFNSDIIKKFDFMFNSNLFIILLFIIYLFIIFLF